jgi:molybdopterin-guanine dinucleotide biosynthesis protein A
MDEDELKKEILEGIKEAFENRIKEIALVTPVDTGFMKSGLSLDVNQNFASIYVSAEYAPYVHYKGRSNDYFSQVLMDDDFLEKI